MKVAIVKHEFTDEKTGEIRPYERLALLGSVGGETHSLELKLTKAELLIAKILLSSNEELTIVPSKINDEELARWKAQNSINNYNKHQRSDGEELTNFLNEE